jgi:hypothetical protein
MFLDALPRFNHRRGKPRVRSQITVVLLEVSPNSNSPERAHLVDLLTAARFKQDRTTPFPSDLDSATATREESADLSAKGVCGNV